MNTDDKGRKPRSEKTIKQKIASAQMRLNRLKSKEKSLSKSAETRLKIILGAEVAKAVGCKVDDVDKEFVLGVLLQSKNVSAEDRVRFKLRGKRFLEDMLGRQE
ncbi:conjugal transfer protein TraD [Salmonella enterica]|uniref:conjugal transfer protein TraD n=1 Tax=Enterobacteriaceae TaxID=543 RepID=UPI00066AC866|nr:MULTISPECIES: conjugal transfer protein TraD [Enterobacteriaceae]EAM8334752.1 conjugal transfer TraD family protein [Salmonella enterica]EBP3677535.1 conjugal transfer protein TraD [Salmonella enterica subsp. enterica]EDQ4869725.1 conjugal transfer protein TraD [Salmonella enterica subsp. enterica serovar Aqua]EDT4217829.1 conjugal transfer protein TraD [Salmonella enterica subsp. salamae]MJK45408.1 conjugal transfer TraD family protein [Salmonella enterica subsp. diarizonae]